MKNILENSEVMELLSSSVNQLRRMGVECQLSPMTLPRGATISLHVAESEELVVAANVALTFGGLFAHSQDGAQQFEREVSFQIAERSGELL